jgi:phosphoserine phosphatase RsbU/P
VGGDYYDFIEFGPKKLGVAIGDVSDKGIPAAFYMTLTKGLLKSQARSGMTPENVLIRLNSLFYENAKRNVFLSMIYGVFDMEAKTFDFARAGHNPVILHRSHEHGTEELNPRGIALGLEPGPIFEQTIEHKRISVKSGDTILLYTDGFNEARNRFQEEFGEKRLMSIIETYNAFSAEELLNQIREEILMFTSGAVQHDDMTAVLIKIV